MYGAKSKDQFEVLSRVRKNKQFSTYCREIQQYPASHQLDLESLLIKPLQRVTKYPLLLKELLNHTIPSHPDYENLQAAYESGKLFAFSKRL